MIPFLERFINDDDDKSKLVVNFSMVVSPKGPVGTLAKYNPNTGQISIVDFSMKLGGTRERINRLEREDLGQQLVMGFIFVNILQSMIQTEHFFVNTQYQFQIEIKGDIRKLTKIGKGRKLHLQGTALHLLFTNTGPESFQTDRPKADTAEAAKCLIKNGANPFFLSESTKLNVLETAEREITSLESNGYVVGEKAITAIEYLKSVMFETIDVSINVEGQTPLMYTAKNGSLEQVQRLVQEFKADISIKDKKGKTAIDYAGIHEISSFLYSTFYLLDL